MKKIPVIEFRNSWIYNVQWHRPKRLQRPPSKKDWATRERRLRQLWTNYGRMVLLELSKITGLSWQEQRIIAYLTWGVRPFSDPLTIPLRDDVFSVFETLVHELIHRICSEEKNILVIRGRWEKFTNLFPKEDQIAINHIPIHAVHELVWQKLFPRRVTALRTDLKLKPYRRSWELLGETGSEKVVKKIFKHT